MQSLRDTARSTARARTLQSLANALEDAELNLTELHHRTDAEVPMRLTALRGIGRWTAQIFLLYELRRPDAFTAWEIGLRQAVGPLNRETEPPTADAALLRADGWHPYRSYAAGHLWRSLAR